MTQIVSHSDRRRLHSTELVAFVVIVTTYVFMRGRVQRCTDRDHVETGSFFKSRTLQGRDDDATDIY